MKGEEQKRLLSIFYGICPSSQLAWNNLNNILEDRNLRLDKIVSYKKVFDFGCTACATLTKLKIINEFIQIERP